MAVRIPGDGIKNSSEGVAERRLLCSRNIHKTMSEKVVYETSSLYDTMIKNKRQITNALINICALPGAYRKEVTMKQRTLAERRARYQEIIRHLTMMSDLLMRNVFKDPQCVEYVLHVIMEQKELTLVDLELQKDYKNLRGRSVILDCVARDQNEKLYNIEIQQENEGASPKRARYHSALMDMNILNTGDNYEALPESCVIFITRNDALGYRKPIYHIARKIEENDLAFGDASSIIYVNAGMHQDTELGRLMKDFCCKNAEDMNSELLANRVRELKETKEGWDHMCREMEILYNEGREDGIDIGAERTKRETAIKLSRRGDSATDIADVLNVSEKQVEEWLSESLVTA